MALKLYIRTPEGTVLERNIEILRQSIAVGSEWEDGVFPVGEVPEIELGNDYFAAALNEGGELAGCIEPEDEGSLTFRWWLGNTKVLTGDGRALYFQPMGAVWSEGALGQETGFVLRSTEDGSPDFRSLGAGAGGWRYVPDERVRAVRAIDSTPEDPGPSS